MTIVHTTHSRYSITGIIKENSIWKVYINDSVKLKEFTIDVVYNDFVEWLSEKMFSGFGPVCIVKAETYIVMEPLNVMDYIKDYVYSKL